MTWLVVRVRALRQKCGTQLIRILGRRPKALEGCTLHRHNTCHGCCCKNWNQCTANACADNVWTLAKCFEESRNCDPHCSALEALPLSGPARGRLPSMRPTRGRSSRSGEAAKISVLCNTGRALSGWGQSLRRVLEGRREWLRGWRCIGIRELHFHNHARSTGQSSFLLSAYL